MNFNTTPVYRAHVKTFSVAQRIPSIDWAMLRVLPPFRVEASRYARNETVKAVLAIRKARSAFPLASKGGTATRVNAEICACV